MEMSGAHGAVAPAAAAAAAGLNRLLMIQAAEVTTCGRSRGGREETQTG